MTHSASTPDNTVSKGHTSSMLTTLGVTSEQFGRHQEQLRRALPAQDSRVLSAPHNSQPSSLPFPLNLPPSYPAYTLAGHATSSTRPQCPPSLRSKASLATRHLSNKPGSTSKEIGWFSEPANASPSKGKAKGTLDAFMDSKQGGFVKEPESSDSDSGTPRTTVLGLPSSDDLVYSDSSAQPSSSPPSSSPLHTPTATPLRNIYAHTSPIPKIQTQDASRGSYVLPPGPYSVEKPSLSLSALIGQALNASVTGALALGDIYSFISTVYPYYRPGQQSWMSSIRHSLSMNESFERIQDQEGTIVKRGKLKAKPKGGFWRIKPGDEVCFANGNFVKKGARGSGPGKNQKKGRKRLREDDEECDDKKSKETSRRRSAHAQPHLTPRRPPSPVRTIYSHLGSRRRSSPPPLTRSQSTPSSDTLLPDPLDLPPSSPVAVEPQSFKIPVSSPGSPDLPLAAVAAKRKAAATGGALPSVSSLGPGFGSAELGGLESSPDLSGIKERSSESDRDLHAYVLPGLTSTDIETNPKHSRLLFPSAVSAFPRSFFPPDGSSSPTRPTTPPPRPKSGGSSPYPIHTHRLHRRLHSSPSRSCHPKSDLDLASEMEGSSSGAQERQTPLPGDRGANDKETLSSTPKRLMFPSTSQQASPFRTPARSTRQHQRGYDPYDPNTLLADELASIRNTFEPQESPGGFFGKEGRKLLYDSPGVPSRSHWRFRNEL